MHRVNDKTWKKLSVAIVSDPYLDLTRMAVTVRQKAIQAVLSLTSGAYQTGLMSYFTHRDLFPSLMKVSLISRTSILWI